MYHKLIESSLLYWEKKKENSKLPLLKSGSRVVEKNREESAKSLVRERKRDLNGRPAKDKAVRMKW